MARKPTHHTGYMFFRYWGLGFRPRSKSLISYYQDVVFVLPDVVSVLPDVVFVIPDVVFVLPGFLLSGVRWIRLESSAGP